LSARLPEALASLIEAERWPESLGPADGVRALERRAHGIPWPVDAFGFEIPLSGGGVDLGVALSARSARREHAPGSGQGPESPSWRRVLRFLDAWTVPGGLEERIVPYVFLEFDTSGTDHAIDEPSLFARISRGRQVDAPVGRIVEDLASTLAGGDVDDAVHRTMSRCTQSLPPTSSILHVGIMYSRGSGHRLHVCLPEQAMAAYLAAIGWGGSMHATESIQNRYETGEGLATLQLETGDRVGSAIGLEFSAPGALEGGAPRWAALFDRLTEDGLCTPARRDAILAWPAVYRQPLTPGGWPCTIRQDLSHVKVVVRPGQPLRAKAYLSVVPSFSLFGAT
jgi:hypothetical protein